MNPIYDKVQLRGHFTLWKRFPDGREELIVDDPNLIVSLGRRVMSRLIAGATASPSILRTQDIGLRVIRSTNGSPTAAWISFENIEGTNEYLLQGHTSAASPEWEISFVAGQTLGTIASQISGQGGGFKWAAAVVSGMSGIDATAILPTPRADCLGTAASYASVPTDSPYTRRIPIYTTTTVSHTEDSFDGLAVDRLRFGTQGHDPDDNTIGKTVDVADEFLTSALRASDLGEASETTDYLTTTPTYASTGQVTFEAVLGGSQANGQYISEAGLFTANHMVARKNFGQILKSDVYEMVVRWTLIF